MKDQALVELYFPLLCEVLKRMTIRYLDGILATMHAIDNKSPFVMKK